MRSKTIWALIVLNVILLASLCFHNVLTSTASAQLGKIPAPSEYMIVSGEAQGATGGVLYIIDTRNGWMSMRAMNQTKIVDFEPIDLARAFK